MSGAIVERLRRLEQQLRTLGELQAKELAEYGERGATLARVHNDELRIVVDEIAAIRAELAAAARPTTAPTSAKRERWLAEEERKANPPPKSRRELLRGRADDATALEDREGGGQKR